jgi:hypothetical protein
VRWARRFGVWNAFSAPAQIYKKTVTTKLENTVRYLGIEVDDTLAISEQVEL